MSGSTAAGLDRRRLARKARAYWRTLFPERFRRYRGSVLPPPNSRMGGPEYGVDEFFLASAISEARRVRRDLLDGPGNSLLDLGCGHGRLAIGLLREPCDLSYLGLDVKRDSVAWCQKYIERQHPSYRFRHVDVLNALYNPKGQPILGGFRLPVPTGTLDVAYLWGVLTNMEPEHLQAYLGEISRMLKPGGRAFVTAHVEEGVPQSDVNPDHYTPYRCQGPLHAVRYERGYFLDSFQRHGLSLTRLEHHAAGNCQSELYFHKS